MSASARQALFWAPRALSIALIAFVSLFATDVFDQHLGFWQTAQALTTHLMPSLVLIVEGRGAVLYAGAGLLYVPSMRRLTWALSIAGPAFLIAGLFLANWLKHGETRTKPR